uniref:Uncharacterized protein n=1 Tax=Oryza sativa subsp. japonica TaxID=39947 RepID=Q6K998_ORYSJ|nr:hypothetical protein [Oryza sativa Japonica Group]BAD19252.1 hypothetical protein [Oryza sativa Japonica Group]
MATSGRTDRRKHWVRLVALYDGPNCLAVAGVAGASPHLRIHPILQVWKKESGRKFRCVGAHPQFPLPTDRVHSGARVCACVARSPKAPKAKRGGVLGPTYVHVSRGCCR